MPQTPFLRLDADNLARNLARMRACVARLDVSLRPHLKTAKSIDIARLAGTAHGIAVSTLAEAEYFAARGIDDILYAVSIVPAKLARIAQLARTGTRVRAILDNPAMVGAVAAEAARLDFVLEILIEVDSDGQRCGVPPEADDLLRIADDIEAASSLRLVGVMTHAGGSYGCVGVGEIAAMAAQERDAVLRAARRLREAGHACPVVSLGSTPTVLFADELDGITEVRAGVYMFMDLVMADLGVCNIDEIALSVEASIVGHRMTPGRVIIDAGALALSKDLGLGRHGYGMVVSDCIGPEEGYFVASVNQEHGLVARNDGAVDFGRFPLGSTVRILPNHACMTAAAFDRYYVARGETDAVWVRCNGWEPARAG